MRSMITVMLGSLMLTGCAGYRITPISPAENKEQHVARKVAAKDGYIFYAPKPYLFATLQPGVDGAPAATYDYAIHYLPDMARPYRFTQYEFLAKSDLKINFENGWRFTGADSSTDSTAALSALAELAKRGIGILSAPDAAQPRLQIWEIKTDGDVFLNLVYSK